MRPALLTLAAVLALAGCSRAPRSASYFEAHPGEIAGALADCKAGAQRGGECDNAALAEAHRQADHRMSNYKKSF